MRTKKVWGMAAVGLVVAAIAIAQTAKVYPGAKKYTPPDNEETREAAKQMPADLQSTTYLSDDAYEKVAGFYRGQGKEFAMPGMQKDAKLPSGQTMHQSFFILDGAEDLRSSKSWVKVQRPFIGSVAMKDGVPEFKDVRDVTAIEVVEKK
jgi:hypothetical protein